LLALTWALAAGGLSAAVAKALPPARAEQPAPPAPVSGPAAPAPAKAAATKPADAPVRPQPPPAPLDPLNITLIYFAVGGITALATLVTTGPIFTYINRGWAWRAQLISCSLGDEAKDIYLDLFHQQGRDETTAARRFDAYYRKWYGRSRLIMPTLLFVILVLVYSLILAIFAAQQLFRATLPVFSDPVTFIAAAAIAGAYMNVSLDAIGRVNRRDLSPEDIYVFALRMVASVPVGYAVASLAEKGLAVFLAFAVGAFPLQQLADVLRRLAAKQIGATAPPEALSDLITKLSGVDPNISDRIGSIGITTVPQLAYSDPIQLTMRTNMNFSFVLDLVSQALAFVYLDDKLKTLRPMGLRGAYELAILCLETRTPTSPWHKNSTAVLPQAAKAVDLTTEQFKNTLHEIADDPYTGFLIHAYGS
jgi:predicted flap endonuclease-1-like 5' DNA nuclease